MDVSQISQILAANKGVNVPPQSPVTSGLKEVGIAARELSDKDLVKAQGRLLTAMEEVQKAAGGTSSLLRSGDLGGAALRTTGTLPSSELHKILASEGRAGAGWSFKQATDGTISAVEHAKHIPGDTITRNQIANAAASKFEQSYGTKVLTQTLENTASRAAQLAGISEKHAADAWSAGQSAIASDKSTVVAREARYSVAQVIKSGEYVAEKAAENAALKTGAKIAGKSIPVIGAGVVLADVFGAGKDAVAATIDGRYKDAGIDATRAVSKLGFGVGTQLANVTLVGGVAMAGAGEGVDYWLQKQKSNIEPSPASLEKEKMIDAFKNGAHNPEALKNDQQFMQYLKDKPGLQNAISVYHGIANSSKNLSEIKRQDILSAVEVNAIAAIQQDRLSDIKTPTISELVVAVDDQQSHK